jgi:hypothetical protein
MTHAADGLVRSEGSRVILTATAAIVALSAMATAQSIAERVDAVRDGQVRMSYEARAGVCGNGRNISTHRSTDDWEPWCEPGPVRVALDIRDGEIIDIDTYVGGRWRRRDRVTDLGTVSPQDAAQYLLTLASTSQDGEVGEDALFPATIAGDVVVWPHLLDIGKDRSLPRDTRKSAVFRLSQAAGDAAAEGLEEIVYEDEGDLEVRESAVFALSQFEEDEGVPILIRIVRTHPDPDIRRKAIFWLGQSDDPRVIDLFEELLLNP